MRDPLPPGMRTTFITAAEATVYLGMTRERVVRRIQSGALSGRLDERYGWLVDVAAVKATERVGQVVEHSGNDVVDSLRSHEGEDA